MIPPEVLEAAVRASVNRDMTGWERHPELDEDTTIAFGIRLGYGAELLCALDVRDPLWIPGFGFRLSNGLRITVNPEFESVMEPVGMSMGGDGVSIDIRTDVPLNVGRVREIMLEDRGHPSPESDKFEVPFWAEPGLDPYGIQDVPAEPLEFDDDALQTLIGMATTGGTAYETVPLCDNLHIRPQAAIRALYHCDAAVELRYDPGPYYVRVAGKLIPASGGVAIVSDSARVFIPVEGWRNDSTSRYLSGHPAPSFDDVVDSRRGEIKELLSSSLSDSELVQKTDEKD